MNQSDRLPQLAAICSLMLGLFVTSFGVASDSGGLDSDGDGLPDSFELANGLNPNSAADADLDPDNDGLSNLVEFLQGLDPQDASSDGSGLMSTNLQDPVLRLPDFLQDPLFRLPDLGHNLVDVDYIGAFAQDEPDNWTLDWTIDINGNTTVWAPAEGGTLAGAEPVADGSCPAGTTPAGTTTLPGGHAGEMDFCGLPRRFAQDGAVLTLTNDNIYLLGSSRRNTYIGNGEINDGNSANDVTSTLVIDAGTLLLGGDGQGLVITRGSDVFVRGTREDPVVMSSRLWFDNWLAGGDGTSGNGHPFVRGEWNGFVIQGYARNNACDGTPCDVEASSPWNGIGYFGGGDNQDDSGEVRYLVIRHSLYGYSLFSAGSGTTSSYVQVHKTEYFPVHHSGSTDHMDHMVLTTAYYPSFDWDLGYRGTAQFVLIREDDSGRSRSGRERASISGRGAATICSTTAGVISCQRRPPPISRPVLANFTLMDLGTESGSAMLLSRATQGFLHNFLVVGFADEPDDYVNACIRLEDAETVGQLSTRPVIRGQLGTGLVISNSLMDCKADETFSFTGSEDIDPSVIRDWWEGGRLNMELPANLMENGQPNSAVGLGNSPSPDVSLFASLLPSSRSVSVDGGEATVFASVINGGSENARDCVVRRRTSAGVNFWFQTTDPQTNRLTGTRNMPVDLAPGQVQTYLLSLDPVTDFSAQEVQFSFECANAAPAPVIPGLNTLLLSAPRVAGPDIIAVTASSSSRGGGTVDVSLANGGVFAIAITNVGATGRVTVEPDFSSLPLSSATVCQIDAAANCLGALGPTVNLEIGNLGVATFAVFLSASEHIDFDPAKNRLRVLFHVGGDPVGATSLAVQTLP